MPGVPFDDDRATIRNEGGRVLGDAGERLSGVYCTGWIKRGPSGVIGTNKKDAAETVELLLEDAGAGRLARESDYTIEELLEGRGVEYIEYEGWEAIHAHELAHGERQGRPRVKLTSWDALLDRARQLGSQS
jgi:ferredoxin--NADP+ reductase